MKRDTLIFCAACFLMANGNWPPYCGNRFGWQRQGWLHAAQLVPGQRTRFSFHKLHCVPTGAVDVMITVEVMGAVDVIGTIDVMGTVEVMGAVDVPTGTVEVMGAVEVPMGAVDIPMGAVDVPMGAEDVPMSAVDVVVQFPCSETELHPVNVVNGRLHGK